MEKTILLILFFFNNKSFLNIAQRLKKWHFTNNFKRKNKFFIIC